MVSAQRIWELLSVCDNTARGGAGAGAHGADTQNAPVHHTLPDRSALSEDRLPFRLQDVYSIRCAPQVLGAARDACATADQWLTTELNSSNDNPLFDPSTGDVYSTGHFCGNHMVLAADLMRNAAATVAELVDRQCLLLLDPRRGGMPANLAPPGDLRRHGLKAVGIAMSALAAEIAHLAAPVAPHSRPTESMNQDIVSMGTIAARRLSDSAALLERMAAMQMIVVSNALARAEERTSVAPDGVGKGIHTLCAEIRRWSPPLLDDRELDHEIEALAQAVRSGELDPLMSDAPRVPEDQSTT